MIIHPQYIKARIKVEIGSRSLKEPYSYRSLRSILGNQFKDKIYTDSEITIPCINPERTYLEKLFLLHEEFQKPKDKIRVDRLSRHLYDLFKISHSKYKKLAMNPTLIKDIIKHRERFNAIKSVDYKTHFPPNLNPIPPDKYLEEWKNDYKKMQNEMIPDASPTFENLLAQIKDDIKEYNSLKIELDG